jgi:hypothetical protein
MKSQGNDGESLLFEMEERACVECEAIWIGTIECPYCGSPGEPLEDSGVTVEPVEQEKPCTTLWN